MSSLLHLRDGPTFGAFSGTPREVSTLQTRYWWLPCSLPVCYWNLAVTFCPGVPRSPSRPEGRRGGEGAELDAGFLLGHVSSQVPRLLHHSEASPHTGRRGTPPRAGTVPHCPVSLRPHSRREGVLELLWSHGAPQGPVLAERETQKKGITFSLHQANVNATGQEGAGDLSLRGEGRKGEEMELLQEPPTPSNWSCANTFAALTLGSLSICSSGHRGSRQQGPTVLKTEASAGGSWFHSWANTWLLNAPLPGVLILQENVGQKILKAVCWGKGSQITLPQGFSIKPAQIPFRGLYY